MKKWFRPRYVAHAKGSTLMRQKAFRFRDDDDSETAATWLAAKDTNISLATDTNFRLRIVVEEYGGSDSNAGAKQLQYRKNGGTWTKVTDSSSDVQHSASTHFADGDGTTQQVGTGTFDTSGSMNESGDNAGGVLSANSELEDEWCLTIVDADVANDDTLEFRELWVFNNLVFDDYPVDPDGPNFPTVTVGTGAAAPTVFPRRQLTTVRM